MQVRSLVIAFALDDKWAGGKCGSIEETVAAEGLDKFNLGRQMIRTLTIWHEVFRADAENNPVFGGYLAGRQGYGDAVLHQTGKVENCGVVLPVDNPGFEKIHAR